MLIPQSNEAAATAATAATAAAASAAADAADAAAYVADGATAATAPAVSERLHGARSPVCDFCCCHCPASSSLYLYVQIAHVVLFQ